MAGEKPTRQKAHPAKSPLLGDALANMMVQYVHFSKVGQGTTGSSKRGGNGGIPHQNFEIPPGVSKGPKVGGAFPPDFIMDV